MRQIIIENFSCIKKAQINFRTFTILIGPQASGKSIIWKLSHFFSSLLEDLRQFYQRSDSFDKYKLFIKEKFAEQFPPSAWGSGKFSIYFESGDYKIRITRGSYRKSVSQGLRIWHSVFLEETYEYAKKLLSSSKSKAKYPEDYYSAEWRVADLVRRKISSKLKEDYIGQQIYIPAGRSFFTSGGKAISVFEQGRMVDSVTAEFGRLYITIREEEIEFNSPWSDENEEMFPSEFNELIGGRVINDKKGEYVQTPDGRKVPFSSLSSGQQEVLPLLQVISAVAQPLRYSRGRHGGQLLVYIEEPEAHLFPESQSKLIAYLCKLLSSSSTSKSNRQKMMITTHSPYILSKINILLKAGALGRSKRRGVRDKVAAIIDRTQWLRRSDVAAYAIINQETRSIMTRGGLIDAEYLDGVSSNISQEFSELLLIEHSNEK